METLICAPTGKAVFCVNRGLGERVAMTIHLFLKKDFKGKAPIDRVVVDESSMVPLMLLYKLIRKVRSHNGRANPFTLTLVGDSNQLTPIKWGHVFHKLVENGRVPTTRLVRNYRNKPGDGINNNALSMLSVGFEGFVTAANCDHVPHSTGELEPIMTKILIYHRDVIKCKPGDVVIVTSTRKHIRSFNELVKKVFFGERKAVKETGKGYYCNSFCVGDRVMVRKNSYKIVLRPGDRQAIGDDGYLTLMNGQEGSVVAISDDTVTVDFDDSCLHTFPLHKLVDDEDEEDEKDVGFSSECLHTLPLHKSPSKHVVKKSVDDSCLRTVPLRKSLSKHVVKKSTDGDEDEEDIDYLTDPTTDLLVHSFSINIHKGQGSGWRRVIVYLDPTEKGDMFRTRNLLYTAITRAEDALVYFGSADSYISIGSKDVPWKCCNLEKRIR